MFNAEADHENDYFWVRDELEEYLPVRRYPGTVEENEEITFEVFITGKIVKKHKSLIVGQVPPPGNISLTNINEDLVENDDISEASVMWSIKKRFFADKIYSAIGPIIIAINPYRHIPEVYSSETLDIYKNSGSADFSTTPPHIWRIAHGAYVKLRTRKVRQAIVIRYPRANTTIRLFFSTSQFNQQWGEWGWQDRNDEKVSSVFISIGPIHRQVFNVALRSGFHSHRRQSAGHKSFARKLWEFQNC